MSVFIAENKTIRQTKFFFIEMSASLLGFLLGQYGSAAAT
jgi:hypothetical protein